MWLSKAECAHLELSFFLLEMSEQLAEIPGWEHCAFDAL